VTDRGSELQTNLLKDKERLRPSSTNYRELQLESQYYNSANSDIIELRWQEN